MRVALEVVEESLGVKPTAVRAPLVDINEAFLELLIGAAKSKAGLAIDFIAEMGDALRALTRSEVGHLARTPFLLLDMEFQNDLWWNGASLSAAGVSTAEKMWLSPFPRASATKLVRSALMLAWHLARSERQSCLVAMGMSPSVTATIALMQPQQIDKIAERHAGRLRLRWEDRPYVWRELLSTASGGDESRRAFALYALQLTFAPRVLR